MPEATENNKRYKSNVISRNVHSSMSFLQSTQCHFFFTVLTVKIFSISLFPSHGGVTGLALFSSCSTKLRTRLKCLNRLRGGSFFWIINVKEFISLVSIMSSLCDIMLFRKILAVSF